MTRRTLSTSARVRIFDAAGGVCCLCGVKIAVGQAWDVAHVIALAAGGSDTPANMRPAHRMCHRVETATVDIPRIAKTKRQRAAHIGAKIKGAGFPKREPQQSRASAPIRKWAAWRQDAGNG